MEIFVLKIRSVFSSTNLLCRYEWNMCKQFLIYCVIETTTTKTTTTSNTRIITTDSKKNETSEWFFILLHHFLINYINNTQQVRSKCFYINIKIRSLIITVDTVNRNVNSHYLHRFEAIYTRLDGRTYLLINWARDTRCFIPRYITINPPTCTCTSDKRTKK